MRTLALVALTLGLSGYAAPHAAPQDALGRWDLTLKTPQGDAPSWLEVRKSGYRTYVGQYVAIVGSARPISKVDLSGDEIRFSIPPQWEEGTGDLVFAGRVQGGRLTGTVTFPDGKSYELTGERAPKLRRTAAPAWGAPIKLFDGKSTAGWKVIQGENQWKVENGILRNTKSGGNLVTERTFGDFKLHVEFRVPKNGNSGIYLRGRHEVQVGDSATTEPDSHLLGGVYGFVTPTSYPARGPMEWQTFDITLVGRTVTVVLNGTTIVSKQEIPGPTGGALDSREGEPGPIMLQGDHTAVDYRVITLTPAR